MTPEEILGKKPIGYTAGTDELEKGFDPSYEQYETPLPKGVSNIDTLVKQLKTYQPKLYRKFVPRVYEGAQGFMDWRIPGATSAAVYMALRDNDQLKSWQAYLNFASWSLQWEEYNNPCFFVTLDFLKAIVNTVVPDNFDLSDFKLPFPSMAFILPKDSPIKFRGRAVPFIGIGRMNAPIKTELGQVTSSKNIDKIVLTTSFLPKAFFAPGIRYDGLNDVVRMKPETLREISHMALENVGIETGAFTPSQDAELILLMMRTAVSLVLAMQSRPELVNKERYLRAGNRIGTATGGFSPAVWQPNVVGARYKIVSEAGTGTHASPRSHWRRGHFRRQRVGSALCSTMNCKHSEQAHLAGGSLCQLPECKCERYTPSWEYKTIWIDPVLVNALAY